MGRLACRLESHLRSIHDRRRGGKSFISALIGVFIACFFSFVEYLTTGERGVVLIPAVDKAQAKVVFNYCKGIIEAIPAPFAAW